MTQQTAQRPCPGMLPLPERVIVIGGLPRSGKSLLRNLLASHSDIAMPPSAFAFFHHFPDDAFAARGGFQGNVEWFFTSCRKSRAWEVRRESVQVRGEGPRDLYLALLDGYRRTHFPDRAIVGEYTHYAEAHFERLLAWFGPRLRFLQVIRDPFDNYASWVVSRKVNPALRAAGGRDAPVHRFCDGWARSAVLGLANAARHPDTCRVYFFEDIKTDPEAFVEGLCRWVGVPPETECMLAMVDVPRRQQNSAFVATERAGPGGGFVRKDDYDRRLHLTPYEQQVLGGAAAFDLLQALGYEDPEGFLGPEGSPSPRADRRAAQLPVLQRTFLSPLRTREQLQLALGQGRRSLVEASAIVGGALAGRVRRRAPGRLAGAEEGAEERPEGGQP